MIDYKIDPFPTDSQMQELWQAAWGMIGPASFEPVLKKSLVHVGAFAEARLVGFVNAAGDGGIHAFILDTCVHPDFRRRGIGVALVRHAAATARGRGAKWLHVDHEPQLECFYLQCGFKPTSAGLIDLQS